MATARILQPSLKPLLFNCLERFIYRYYQSTGESEEEEEEDAVEAPPAKRLKTPGNVRSKRARKGEEGYDPYDPDDIEEDAAGLLLSFHYRNH